MTEKKKEGDKEDLEGRAPVKRAPPQRHPVTPEIPIILSRRISPSQWRGDHPASIAFLAPLDASAAYPATTRT